MKSICRLVRRRSRSRLAAPALAALNVFATVPEWGALAQELGGDKVNVYVATNALQDPHHVEAKPSLIARARNADLVVATGAELEIGWLPLVTQQAGNPRIQPGKPGYFEAAPLRADAGKARRASTAPTATCIAARRSAYPDRSAQHPARRAHRWRRAWPSSIPPTPRTTRHGKRHSPNAGRAAIANWEKEGASLRGVPVVVQHKAFTYLIAWLGMNEVAALEPKPGVEPTTAYMTDGAGNAAAAAGRRW